ncbi:hypothetical protein OROGR_025496 [Orobanche gracilis]
MLEKLGLPPKPSMRGNSWVVDASHCQGCSSQFTFINRKHHCRRCGGIFCSNCTQQRMVLRGQGDSPVRICEPCKKLEEAARFELRYGRKSRDATGSSKYTSRKDGEILKDILDNEDNPCTEKTSACCSYTTPIEGGDIVRNELGPTTTTPEDLREQAIFEKQKYKTLKAEGKSEEALRAFKRGKELERQAGALELSLRKNRKRALSSNYLNDTQQTKDDLKAPIERNKFHTKNSRETDDIFTELKDLGWSDRDLHDAGKGSVSSSVEGELSSLLKEVSQKPNKEKPAVSSDKSLVIVHKKRALELKRSGNLSEAKEELKRAKILERKIEEEEFLGEVDDSDDELSSLIRSMDGEEQRGRDISGRHNPDFNFDFGHFTGIGDDLALDGDFQVTDEDMYDPELNSALESLGWTEDNTDRESIVTEIQSLKREALNQKRAGNTAEAMALLIKAKLLEKEHENSCTHEMGEPFFSFGPIVNDTGPKTAPKSKLTIQKELLALKKKALSLRREGKLDESAEELEKAQALEDQLEDLNKVPPVRHLSIGNEHSYDDINANTLGNEGEEDVTDQDLHDPAYLSLLKNLGWEDEDTKYTTESAISQPSVDIDVGTSSRSGSEIQRELLRLKRKALGLRRQGEAEEANEVLKMAKLLEGKLHEPEEATQREEDSPENTDSAHQVDPHDSTTEDLEKQAKDDMVVISPQKPNETIHERSEKPNSDPLQQEILAHKKRAIKFKREGKLAEAKEALRQAKLLEKKGTEEDDVPQISGLSADKEASPRSVSKPLLSSRDKFKLQQESLGHKRQALKLRREGRMDEADSEFELAKSIETRLQESNPSGSAELADNVVVEDYLDPQLLSMLQSIGLDDGHAKPQGKLDADANAEREQLTARIKGEKVKAVNLKRSGKQAEALDALRRAKLYEKKLQALTS